MPDGRERVPELWERMLLARIVTLQNSVTYVDTLIVLIAVACLVVQSANIGLAKTVME